MQENEILELQKKTDDVVLSLFQQPPEFVIQSTGFDVISGYTGVFYNVSGSTDDPPIPGFPTWKGLLVERAGLSDARCYVENIVAPSGTSHNNFSVGGHMTKNEDGSVELGGKSYLIPLCSWHNHTNRNGKAFEVENKTIMELSGYMRSEPFATFAARLPTENNRTYGLVYRDIDDGFWKHKNLTDQERETVTEDMYPQHIVFKKAQQIEDTCSIHGACL